MDKSEIQKLIDRPSKNDRATFEVNSGKVSSDVWKHFQGVILDHWSWDGDGASRDWDGIGTAACRSRHEKLAPYNALVAIVRMSNCNCIAPLRTETWAPSKEKMNSETAQREKL